MSQMWVGISADTLGAYIVIALSDLDALSVTDSYSWICFWFFIFGRSLPVMDQEDGSFFSLVPVNENTYTQLWHGVRKNFTEGLGVMGRSSCIAWHWADNPSKWAENTLQIHLFFFCPFSCSIPKLSYLPRQWYSDTYHLSGFLLFKLTLDLLLS